MTNTAKQASPHRERGITDSYRPPSPDAELKMFDQTDAEALEGASTDASNRI